MCNKLLNLQESDQINWLHKLKWSYANMTRGKGRHPWLILNLWLRLSFITRSQYCGSWSQTQKYWQSFLGLHFFEFLGVFSQIIAPCSTKYTNDIVQRLIVCRICVPSTQHSLGKKSIYLNYFYKRSQENCVSVFNNGITFNIFVSLFSQCNVSISKYIRIIGWYESVLIHSNWIFNFHRWCD